MFYFYSYAIVAQSTLAYVAQSLGRSGTYATAPEQRLARKRSSPDSPKGSKGGSGSSKSGANKKQKAETQPKVKAPNKRQLKAAAAKLIGSLTPLSMSLSEILHSKLAQPHVRQFVPAFLVDEATADSAAVAGLMAKWGLVLKGEGVPEDMPTADETQEQCKNIGKRCKDLEHLIEIAAARAK